MADHRAVYPYWSIISFSFPLILIAILRRHLKPKLRDRFYLAEEFLCSLLWLLWSFEMTVVSNYTHSYMYHLLLFLALLFQRSIYQEATVNTAALVVKWVHCGWSLKKTFLLLSVQLATIPVAMATILYLHRALSFLSLPHEMGVAVSSDALKVGIAGGFLVEGLGMFLLSLPPIFITSRGFFLDVVSASSFTLIGYVLGPLTGAFCNPLSATCYCLIFNKQNVIEVGVVYWAGTIAGALLAWRLFVYQREKEKST